MDVWLCLDRWESNTSIDDDNWVGDLNWRMSAQSIMIEANVGEVRTISKDGNSDATSSKLSKNRRWISSMLPSKFVSLYSTKKDSMSDRYASKCGGSSI